VCAIDSACAWFVALDVCVQPEVTEEGQQTSPPGMYAIPLPFADDFRLVGLGEKGAQTYVTVDPEGDATLTAAAAEENAAIAAAEAVINKLRMKKFSCHNFENPTLQKHFAVMQALALGEDEVSWKPESDDHLMPDLDGMAKFTVRCFAPPSLHASSVAIV
jgi:ATP-dependent DNA helicase 2 subunit 1